MKIAVAYDNGNVAQEFAKAREFKIYELEKGVVHTIVSVIPGYYIGKTAESYRNILAITVWQIATDSGKILYYDARNGQLIKE